MTSSISSLGLGSNGILSSDLITKLKTADESTLIKPIENKINVVEKKLEGVKSISDYINSLQSNITDLANHISLSYKTVNNSSVSVENGVDSQDFSIKVLSLASIDMYQTKSFSAPSNIINGTETSITMNINNKNYEYKIGPQTSLESLKVSINNDNSGIKANILNVGENQYKLVIKTTDTGVKNKITFSGDITTLNTLGLNDNGNHLKSASNSEFEFNGVAINRSSNRVSDLINGVTINLNDSMKTLTNIEIKDDMDKISKNLTSFVDSYNTLKSYLSDNTKYDSTTKTSNLFQNESSFKSFNSTLSSLYNDNSIFLNSLGISKSDDKLSLNTSTLNGITEKTKKALNTENYFNKLSNLLDKYDIDKSNSYLSTYQLGLKTQKTKLDTNLSTTNQLLSTRYEIMTKRFATYDSIISKYTSSFDVLNNIIKQSYNNNN